MSTTASEQKNYPRPYDHDGSPIDSVMVLSFGGPNGPDDVRPFLENVTRGRGIPPERLDEVGAHYAHFGGKSPLNELNLEIIDHLEKEFEDNDIDLPIFFANRNWHPMIEDVLTEITEQGFKHVLVIATSAWGGYSGSIQYEEDITRAIEHVRDQGLTPPQMTKVPPFFQNPEFIEAFAEETRKAFQQLPEDKRDDAHLIFTAHSIPTRADESSAKPENGGELYSEQVAEASKAVADALGMGGDYAQVWQSRSGAPHIPWLEPDIVEYSMDLAASESAPENIVVVPIGFLSDHIEVEWDLDSELAEVLETTDMNMIRAKTIGHSPRFARMLKNIVDSYPRNSSRNA